MVERVEVATVQLWDHDLGAVSWDEGRRLATFEYFPSFIASGLEVAPLMMPLGAGFFSFPELASTSYRGLPGLVADSLPDRYGNDLIDSWLAGQGRDPASFSPIERLCYVGSRGMGALEYHPAVAGRDASSPIRVDELAALAEKMLRSRQGLQVDLDDDALAELLLVGTSAGGARAKAILAWNPETNEVRSGQVPAPAGSEYWLLKFDGVGSSDHDLSDAEGYGRIEYAYHLMAAAAGIELPPSRLFEDAGGRAHFMTKRFDRTDDGNKFHMQTLSALAHLDYNQAGAHSYERALAITLQLCGAADVEQLFRRLVFNILSRNQDDHTKNISFIMGRNGAWRLSPAYDVTWAYNPTGKWTSQHQMTVAGKRDEFVRSDLRSVAQTAGVRQADALIEDVATAVADWERHAAEASVNADYIEQISSTHRAL